MFGMNAVVAITPPALIWPTQYTADMGCKMDLSANGMMPRHQLLLLLFIFIFDGETGYVPTYLVAQFSSLKASRRCKQLEGGVKRKPYLLLT
jgi:hypothetical protein